MTTAAALSRRPRPTLFAPRRAAGLRGGALRRRGRAACRAGLSLIEMLVALAISAVLLTATAVAIDTSFTAYAIAAESASTQTSTRMVINRLLTIVRTSTAHDPMFADADAGVTIHNNILTSPYLTVQEPSGDLITISYEPPPAGQTTGRLMLVRYPNNGAAPPPAVPLLGGVTACSFKLARRRDNDGVWVLERGSIDFTVEADDDASLDLEEGNVPPVRVLASTKPRRLD
ncbi:MAG: prepilin-type N-terminal cleavage/methylation domain-containing protein [Planctomycetota bacterium]